MIFKTRYEWVDYTVTYSGNTLVFEWSSVPAPGFGSGGGGNTTSVYLPNQVFKDMIEYLYNQINGVDKT